jgi:hypothetical protein
LASGEAWAQDVFAQSESALLVVGGDSGSCVQVEAMVLGAQFAFGNGAVVGVEHDANGFAFVGRLRTYRNTSQVPMRTGT